MGENDGGLLEREWDGYMEPNLHTILELFDDEDFEAREYLQQGLLFVFLPLVRYTLLFEDNNA